MVSVRRIQNQRADGTVAPDENAHYRARYIAFAARGLDYLVDQAQAAGDALPDVETQGHALYLLGQTLSLPGIWPTVRRAVEVLAPQLEQAGHRDEWIEMLEAALARSRDEGDGAGEALFLYHLGILYRLQARYPEADQSFTDSAERYADLGDVTGQAMVWSRHAYLAWTQRDFERARRLAEESLARRVEQPDRADPHAYCRLVLGALAFETDRWQEAYDQFQAAHVLWQQHGNRRMAATALFNQALALQQMQQYVEAIALYHQAIDLLDAIGDVSGWAIAQMNLGILHRRQRSYAAALDCYRRAEVIFRRTGNTLLLARIYNNEGNVYRDLGQLPEAEQAYQLSIAHWETLGNVSEQVNALDSLIDIRLTQNRFTEAALILDEARRLLQIIPDDPAYPHLSTLLAETGARLPGNEERGNS